MKRDCILAIDQGTTNTKALLLDRSNSIVGYASRPLSVEFPQPAWVEQDAREIWRSVEQAISDCCEQSRDGSAAAIAISNQRESAILWDRITGEPLGPCVTWQCRRSAPVLEKIRARGLESMLRQNSGLPLDPLFSGGKLRWLLDQVRDGTTRAQQGEICAGTVDSWLLWKLSGGRVHACDMTNASRTQLFNIHRAIWDPELLKAFEIPAEVLPQVQPSSYLYAESIAIGKLQAGTPVASLIGDSHAALFGHASFYPGALKATYGTGSSLMTLTEGAVMSGHGLSSTIAWGLPSTVQYALEGNISVTGSAVQWVAELLGLKDQATAVTELANQVPDSGGIYLVPAFVGLGAPYWDSSARGLLTGLTRGTTAAHLARATLESIAFQVRDVVAAMESDADSRISELMVDGGASRNDLLMQMQADILGVPVIRGATTELSAVGAGWLAGLAIEFWSSLEELACLPRREQNFEPRMSAAERESRYGGWQEAIHRARCPRDVRALSQ